MKKTFWLVGLLAMVGVLFAACWDQRLTEPEEALFGKKVANGCTGDLPGEPKYQLDAIDDEIDIVLMSRPSKGSAPDRRQHCAGRSVPTHHSTTRRPAWWRASTISWSSNRSTNWSEAGAPQRIFFRTWRSSRQVTSSSTFRKEYWPPREVWVSRFPE